MGFQPSDGDVGKGGGAVGHGVLVQPDRGVVQRDCVALLAVSGGEGQHQRGDLLTDIGEILAAAAPAAGQVRSGEDHGQDLPEPAGDGLCQIGIVVEGGRAAAEFHCGGGPVGRSHGGGNFRHAGFQHGAGLLVIGPDGAAQLAGIGDGIGGRAAVDGADGQHRLGAGSQLPGVQLLEGQEDMGGGGHQTMAGAQLRNTTFEEVRAKLNAAIDEYLSELNPEPLPVEPGPVQMMELTIPPEK